MFEWGYFLRPRSSANHFMVCLYRTISVNYFGLPIFCKFICWRLDDRFRTRVSSDLRGYLFEHLCGPMIVIAFCSIWWGGLIQLCGKNRGDNFVEHVLGRLSKTIVGIISWDHFCELFLIASGYNFGGFRLRRSRHFTRGANNKCTPDLLHELR